MLTATFPVTVLEGGRADAVLSSMVDGLTRSAAQKWMEEGRVTLNGKPVKKNTPLKPGDTLLVSPPQPQDIHLIPQDIPLDIVYEDDDVVVVNKPVGMVVHPAPGHPDGTLVNALLYHCKNTPGTPRGCSLWPRTTGPTWPWLLSSKTIPCSASTTPWWWGASRSHPAR